MISNAVKDSDLSLLRRKYWDEYTAILMISDPLRVNLISQYINALRA
ncbi:hypothetical protein SCH4B_2154 [Ruegeria sp. TrichCH4B]|nr:hypothetical protein SCH4B_2154 [Ruegeria sp. TrichCH4B]